jgi:hypothetical protein
MQSPQSNFALDAFGFRFVAWAGLRAGQQRQCRGKWQTGCSAGFLSACLTKCISFARCLLSMRSLPPRSNSEADAFGFCV